MNILIFTRSTATINQCRPEIEIYCKLAELGHPVTVVTNTTPELKARFQQAGVNLIENIVSKKICIKSIKILRKELSTNKYDIVYACCSKTIPNAAIACIGFNVKLVAYRGTTGGLHKSDLTNYLTLLNPRIDGVICVSNAVQRHVEKKVRQAIKSNVKTIYKGHDLNWYKEPAIDLTSINSNKNNFNVLCIASTRPHKGLQYLLTAAKYLKDIQNLRIILVGHSIDTEPFNSLITDSGMSNNIIQLGFRQDVPQIASACDVLVLPSIREGLPRAVLESLANGTPVITSANEGAMEIIENDKNGYIVPIADGEAIAERIRYLHQNKEALTRLEKNTFKTIETKMSHQQTVKNMIKYFEEIINQ